MNALFGSPALALLLRLKLRGLARRQWRRLRTPKGFLLTVLGFAAFALWVVTLDLHVTRPQATFTGADGELRARALALHEPGHGLTERRQRARRGAVGPHAERALVLDLEQIRHFLEDARDVDVLHAPPVHAWTSFRSSPSVSRATPSALAFWSFSPGLSPSTT